MSVQQLSVHNLIVPQIHTLALRQNLKSLFFLWKPLENGQCQGVSSLQKAGPNTRPLLREVLDSLLEDLFDVGRTLLGSKGAPPHPATTIS
jgi:hypothetical protein